jgi:hypothetical protein
MTKKERYAAAIKEILGNREASDIQIEDELIDLLEELIPEGEEKAAAKHWPGRYKPKDSKIWTIFANGRVHSATLTEDDINKRKILGISCETQDEVEFVKAHLEAKNELIETLEELNGGWRPDWANPEESKYEPYYDRNGDRLVIAHYMTVSSLPDCFQIKSPAIWRLLIERIGEEKIKLALWPRYGEKKNEA